MSYVPAVVICQMGCGRFPLSNFMDLFAKQASAALQCICQFGVGSF